MECIGVEEESSLPPEEEKFFSDIVGYPDIKKLFMKSVVSKEPIHTIIDGTPSIF